MMKVRKYLTIWLLIALTMVGVPEASAFRADENAFDTKYSTAITYRFVHPLNPITHLNLNVTGNINAGSIPLSVEVLMNTSTLVKPSTPAPGVVFKNVNILVGTSDFTNERSIKHALIGFRVDNFWLKDNGIAADEVKMVKWDGSKWITLGTKLKEKDGKFTYFEAETSSNFSPFAITAMKAIKEAKPGGFLAVFGKIVQKFISP